MAPGTRPDNERYLERNFDTSELFEEPMENTQESDPWLGIPGANQLEEDESVQESFEDSFVGQETEGAVGFSSNTYRSNSEYLNYLESKLKRLEGKRQREESRVTSKDVLKSLKDIKDKQLEWNFRHGISSEDDTLDSDSSGGSNSLTSELRRKMFPEQHALNDTELLRLIDHDVIEKIFHQLEMTGTGNSSTSQ